MSIVVLSDKSDESDGSDGAMTYRTCRKSITGNR